MASMPNDALERDAAKNAAPLSFDRWGSGWLRGQL
jgi:hypothetical protein